MVSTGVTRTPEPSGFKRLSSSFVSTKSFRVSCFSCDIQLDQLLHQTQRTEAWEDPPPLHASPNPDPHQTPVFLDSPSDPASSTPGGCVVQTWPYCWRFTFQSHDCEPPSAQPGLRGNPTTPDLTSWNQTRPCRPNQTNPTPVWILGRVSVYWTPEDH